jgi:hypothetical protein
MSAIDKLRELGLLPDEVELMLDPKWLGRKLHPYEYAAIEALAAVCLKQQERIDALEKER